MLTSNEFLLKTSLTDVNFSQKPKQKDSKMSIIKKISLAVAAVAIVSTSSFAGQVLVGGNIPLINNIIGVGNLNLDLTVAGADAVLATFIINNNSPDFEVTWTLTNGGSFVNVQDATLEIAMTSQQIVETTGQTGTLGTGATALPLALAAGTATWTNSQTSATENYMVDLAGTWAAPAAAPLAGLYTEEVVFTIAATM